MSQPIFPLAVWLSGTNENSIPANDNALRVEVLMGPALDVADSEPVDPEDGDQYVIGTAWGGFTTDNVVIYKGGTWLEWEAFTGWVKTIDGVQSHFDGSDWVEGGGGGGAVDSVNGQVGVVVLDADDVGAIPAADASTFATAAQGTLADSAVQPGDLAAIATSGDVGDLVGFPGGTTTFLRADGTFATPAGGGGGGSPGGSNTQVQYNDSGAFAGAADFTYVSGVLTIPRIDTGKGTDIARASTTDIWSATGNFVHLTGTTTITSFGANTAGMARVVRFAGAGTLTHNATSLILPGGANITTAANDTALVVGEGSSNARVVVYQRANGQALVASTGASLTNFTGSLNTASPNNSTNAARLLVTGGSTNVDFVTQPKGTGALLGQLPDGAASGGNKRGMGAVDWQLIRDNAADVASGNYAFIGGGYSNQASGTYTTVGGGIYNRITANEGSFIGSGYGNTITGQFAGIVAGSGNTASGESSCIAGGQNSTASGFYSGVTNGSQCTVSGRFSRAGGHAASDRGINGVDAFASASFAGSGDLQLCTYHLGMTTSDATATTASTTGATAVGDNQIVLPDNSAYRLKGHAIARQNTTGDCKSWDLAVTIKRGAAAANTAIVGTAVVTSVDSDTGASTWAIALTADTTTGCLRVQVTGQSSKTIKWSIRLDSIEAVG